MKAKLSIAVGAVLLGIVAWLVWGRTPHEPAPSMQPAPAQAVIPSASAPVVEQRPPRPPGHRFGERASEFTEDERVALTNLFMTKLKPAAEKWCLLYSNRVPFKIADLTLDKFAGRIGTRIPQYAFVMGDITLTIEDYFGTYKVRYLASRQAMTAMAALPTDGAAPDLSMPVTREQVMALVTADSGVQFPPNEVTLTPTGASGSFAGGVNAEIGKEVNNPNGREFGGTNYSLMFGSNGQLVYYERSEIANVHP